MGLFPVSQEKERALLARLDALGVAEADVEETFVRSGGHGGQNVNKLATCVQLRHGPTGVEVKCSKARTQGMNRYHARVILADRIETIQKGVQSAEQQRIEKVRRQKRRRSRRAKQRMLEDKHHQSDKKQSRAPIKPHDAQ